MNEVECICVLLEINEQTFITASNTAVKGKNRLKFWDINNYEPKKIMDNISVNVSPNSACRINENYFIVSVVDFRDHINSGIYLFNSEEMALVSVIKLNYEVNCIFSGMDGNLLISGINIADKNYLLTKWKFNGFNLIPPNNAIYECENEISAVFQGKNNDIILGIFSSNISILK